jgi:hypothetical protein
MRLVGEDRRQGIAKYCGSLIEGHVMLPEVVIGFGDMPLKAHAHPASCLGS